MAAAGPAPRGSSLTGARPFQYGAAANNTSSSTQRKQHWRLTALAPAAPPLAARPADAHRGSRSPPRLHGKCSLAAGRRRETTCAAMHCGRRASRPRPSPCPGPRPAPARPLSFRPGRDRGAVPAAHGARRFPPGAPFSAPALPGGVGACGCRPAAGGSPEPQGSAASLTKRREKRAAF